MNQSFDDASLIIMDDGTRALCIKKEKENKEKKTNKRKRKKKY
jgi:hypothetical protein